MPRHMKSVEQLTEEYSARLRRITEAAPCIEHGQDCKALCTECNQTVMCKHWMGRGCQCWNDE